MRKNWFLQNVRRFRRLPEPLLITFVFSRFIFGVGLGALLSGLFTRQQRRHLGWAIMAIGTVLAVPGARRILTAR